MTNTEQPTGTPDPAAKPSDPWSFRAFLACCAVTVFLLGALLVLPPFMFHFAGVVGDMSGFERALLLVSFCVFYTAFVLFGAALIRRAAQRWRKETGVSRPAIAPVLITARIYLYPMLFGSIAMVFLPIRIGSADTADVLLLTDFILLVTLIVTLGLIPFGVRRIAYRRLAKRTLRALPAAGEGRPELCSECGTPQHHVKRIRPEPSYVPEVLAPCAGIFLMLIGGAYAVVATLDYVSWSFRAVSVVAFPTLVVLTIAWYAMRFVARTPSRRRRVRRIALGQCPRCGFETVPREAIGLGGAAPA